MNRDQLTVSLKGGTEHVFSPPPSPTAPLSPRRRKRRDWTGLALVVLIIAVCVGAYFYLTREEPILAEPQTPEEAEEQALSIIERVGKHIVLPEDEEPTIATVSDPSKLQEQTFFANAKVGDVVLIYAGARKAYLYDPTIDKLLEVAPIAQ